MMLDREKVIKGLECHADRGGNCLECPYGHYGVDDKGLECENKLAIDALEVINRQNEKLKKYGSFIVMSELLEDIG